MGSPEQVGPTSPKLFGPTLDLLPLAFAVSCKDIDERLLGGSEIKGGDIRKYPMGSS